MTFPWFAASPTELPPLRVNLTFGLRPDDLFYRNRVVPRVGRVWFVRELSWALGALALRSEIEGALGVAPPPIAVAHAIEALGSKLEWRASDDIESGGGRRRIMGVRAFQRDPEFVKTSFRDLSRRQNYVQNTHRQMVVRALQARTGLGLAAGTRFSDMHPTGLGRDLADAFLDQTIGQGRARLGSKLVDWVAASREESAAEVFTVRTAVAALGPSSPSEPEQRVVREAILGGSGPEVETRKVLARILLAHEEFPSIEDVVVPALVEQGRPQQAREVVAARAFGALLDALIDLTAALASSVASASGGVPLDELAKVPAVDSGHDVLRERARQYRDRATEAGTYAMAKETERMVGVVEAGPSVRVLEWIQKRAPGVFEVPNGRVSAGPLLSRVAALAGYQSGESADEGPTPEGEFLTERTFYLEAFHQLVHDCVSHPKEIP